MRIARFSLNDTMAFGVVEGDGVTEPESVRPLRGHPFGELDFLEGSVPLAGLRMLAPVLPSKIVAIGKNYADHVAEFDGQTPAEPLMFLKPNTAVIGPGGTITLPEQSERVDFEAELAVVIGRLCRDVAPEDADQVILGYTCANDVTARDLQARDGQWTRAKGFDTFCPLGPYLVTGLGLDQVGDLELTTRRDGEVVQRSRTSLMVYDVVRLVSHISSVMTLLPGDVILTGTPAGVGPITAGQRVEVEIEGIGVLSNPVVPR